MKVKKLKLSQILDNGTHSNATTNAITTHKAQQIPNISTLPKIKQQSPTRKLPYISTQSPTNAYKSLVTYKLPEPRRTGKFTRTDSYDEYENTLEMILRKKDADLSKLQIKEVPVKGKQIVEGLLNQLEGRLVEQSRKISIQYDSKCTSPVSQMSQIQREYYEDNEKAAALRSLVTKFQNHDDSVIQAIVNKRSNQHQRNHQQSLLPMIAKKVPDQINYSPDNKQQVQWIMQNCKDQSIGIGCIQKCYKIKQRVQRRKCSSLYNQLNLLFDIDDN